MIQQGFMRQFTLFILLGVALLAGIGAADSSSKGGASVRIRDLQFQPSSVKLKVGQSVTWSNADDRDHAVEATDNSFKSGNLKPGAVYTFRFTKAGNFDYACPYHPRMRGSVQVEN